MLEIVYSWFSTNYKKLEWGKICIYHGQLLRKSMDWLLYDNGLRHEKVNRKSFHTFFTQLLFIFYKNPTFNKTKVDLFGDYLVFKLQSKISDLNKTGINRSKLSAFKK